MARTRRIARKSTGRLPVGQLAPQNVLQPQESRLKLMFTCVCLYRKLAEAHQTHS
jgi:hypothetical protein